MSRIGSGIYVEVRNGDLDTALKIFSRKVKDYKLILQIKERSFYEKPSTIRRRKRMAAKLRSRSRDTNL